jgi:nitric oxide synthase-interacting protein
MGSLKQRLGTDSHLPFGHCALSTYPTDDAVVSPSGHLYGRESMLEYLLTKSKELKRAQQLFDAQQARLEAEQREEARRVQRLDELQFLAATDGIESVAKRKIEHLEDSSEFFRSRKKVIDDTDKEVRMEELKKVSPWVPQFTPQATATAVKEPPKRPPSPFTGRPLRAKDLIPVNLIKEHADGKGGDAKVRYICPVTR